MRQNEQRVGLLSAMAGCARAALATACLPTECAGFGQTTSIKNNSLRRPARSAICATDFGWLVLWAATLSAVLPANTLAGDAAAGAKIFDKCAVCHSLKTATRKIGPTLNGVIGRTAGTLPDYKYSGAMVLVGEGGLVWTEDQLADYLANPRRKVPGTAMTFAGLKNPADIADVVAYIKQYSPN
jgi:cytochrome c